MKFFEVGLHRPLGRRGGEGQYCLLNVSTIANGGTGATRTNAREVVSRGTSGTDQLVAMVQGANRGVSDRGASSQIVTACALPMPTNVRVDYGADWSMDNTGVSERAISFLNDAVFGNQSLSDLSNGVGMGIASNLANQLVKIGYSTAFRKAIKDNGYAYNPHKELFYNGPTFRSFPLEWNFSFEDKRQADAFDDMIEALAEHMHPDFIEGAQSGVWKIPDTFYIEYVNANVRKIGACVLTNMNVNYTNAGSGWKAFTDGNPAHVSLALTFLELAPLTKADIKAGR